MFQIALILAAFLCSLVAGFLFAFAAVVMPGIKSLGDSDFIRAFQVMDGVIQKNQPVFILVWLGSAIAVLGAAVLGIEYLDAAGRWLMISAVLIYILGVQVPTIAINIPLNNRLQTLDVDSLDDSAIRVAREAFEGRWNRTNLIRTMLSCLVSVLLMILLIRY